MCSQYLVVYFFNVEVFGQVDNFINQAKRILDIYLLPSEVLAKTKAVHKFTGFHVYQWLCLNMS